MLVGASTAGMSASVVIALHSLGMTGAALALGLLACFVCLTSVSVSREVIGRSGQALGTLRAVGATKGDVASTVTTTLTASGAVGALLGAGLGAALGAAIGLPAPALSVLVELFAVLCLASAAVGGGAYAGVELAWHR